MEATPSLLGCLCSVPSPWNCLHQASTHEAMPSWCLAWCLRFCTRRTAPALLWLASHHPRGTGAAHGLRGGTQGIGHGETSPSFWRCPSDFVPQRQAR